MSAPVIRVSVWEWLKSLILSFLRPPKPTGSSADSASMACPVFTTPQNSPSSVYAGRSCAHNPNYSLVTVLFLLLQFRDLLGAT